MACIQDLQSVERRRSWRQPCHSDALHVDNGSRPAVSIYHLHDIAVYCAPIEVRAVDPIWRWGFPRSCNLGCTTTTGRIKSRRVNSSYSNPLAVFVLYCYIYHTRLVYISRIYASLVRARINGRETPQVELHAKCLIASDKWGKPCLDAIVKQCASCEVRRGCGLSTAYSIACIT